MGGDLFNCSEKNSYWRKQTRSLAKFADVDGKPDGKISRLDVEQAFGFKMEEKRRKTLGGINKQAPRFYYSKKTPWLSIEHYSFIEHVASTPESLPWFELVWGDGTKNPKYFIAPNTCYIKINKARIFEMEQMGWRYIGDSSPFFGFDSLTMYFKKGQLGRLTILVGDDYCINMLRIWASHNNAGFVDDF